LGMYPIFLLLAGVTILSPGPGVLKSLTNALNYGLRPALVGIAGLACGVFCVAALSATGLGVLLSTSHAAFMFIRLVGAGYLIYLGIRLWRAPLLELDPNSATARTRKALFFEGWMLQFSNPNAVFFFLSVLPQFIDRTRAFLPQFLLLALTFCFLLVLVHGSYALCAQRARRLIRSRTGGRWLNRVGGAAFVVFGLLLLHSGG